jgi:uncharacterized protein YjdB
LEQAHFFDFFDFAVNLPRNGMRVNPRTFDKLIGEMMMKRVLVGLFAALMVVAGCADSDDSGSGDSGEGTGPGGSAVTGVAVNTESLVLEVKESAVLTFAVIPASAKDKAVTWASDKEDVATVVNGTVTGKAEGNAAIIVTTKDGNKKAICNVTVVDGIGKVEVKLDHTQLVLTAGDTAELTVDTGTEVQWMSSNTGVATVDKDGKVSKVSGVAVGTATITVTAKCG